jgi:plasmid stability protein
MTQEEKSKIYQSLLHEHDKVSNLIAAIKGESIDLNEEQNMRISKLQNQLRNISNQMMSLMK